MFQRVASIAAPQDAGCRSSSKFSSLVLVGSKFSVVVVRTQIAEAVVSFVCV